MNEPFKHKKRLGQHFMTSPRDLATVAGALSIVPGETVLEIGPGHGALTRVLLNRGASVVAVEKDTECIEYLKNAIRPGAALNVFGGDILDVDIEKDLGLQSPVKVAGNIPYYITSPILEWLIDQRRRVSEAVLTVQWEVVRRLRAVPGNKDWGSLSVFLQFYADVKLVRKIDKSHFNPPPKVDSGIIHIAFLTQPRFPGTDEAMFFSLVRRAFQKRRKTLLNALGEKKSGPEAKEALNRAFSRTGIEPQRRPETLSLQEWVKLVACLPAGRVSLGTPAPK